jgi:aspartyl-tRNA(Asn)/glutamyl-tRNA(Gln) amidotransferase subunit C
MTEFDSHTLAHLKKLCKISCTPEEEEDILNSLPRILEYAATLNEVNTDDVKPCSYVLSSMLKNQMREDEVNHLLPREQFLANAPDQIGGMIRVPPVLK